LPPSNAKRAKNNYDPLPWSDFYDEKILLDDRIPTYIAGTKGIVFLCLHGAAHSALSFASLARRLKTDFTVVSFDFRGHGEHRHENEADLSVQTLVFDTAAVFDALVGKYPERSFIFVGHSMGGSIATKTLKYLLERDGMES